MAKKKSNTILKAVIDSLNEYKEISVQDLAKLAGCEEVTLWGYIYPIENVGFIYRYGSSLVLRKEMPTMTYYELMEYPSNEMDYYQERLDRIKGKLTIEITKSLTILECLYFIQDNRTSITTEEYSKLTGKGAHSAYVMFAKLIKGGYMELNNGVYTFLKKLPVVVNQSEFTNSFKKKLIQVEDLAINKPKKPAKKKLNDLSWIAKYANSFERITKDEKNILLNALYSSAVCL